MLSSSRLASRSIWVLVAAAIVVAACSSDAAAPATTGQPATTAVTQPATTTEAPTTTTTAAPTSTAPPTSSQAEIEAELIRVVEGSYKPFYLDPIDPQTPLVDEFYDPRLAEIVRSNMQDDADAANTYFGEFVLGDVREVRLAADVATLVACGTDAVGSRSPEGVVEVEPDVTPLLREYELVNSGDAWLLSGVAILVAPEVPCE